MRTLFKKSIGYGLFWLSFFIISRFIFLTYNLTKTGQLTFAEIIGSYIHGSLLDMSLTGYILFFYILFVILFFWASEKIIKPFFLIFTTILLIVFSFLLWIDVELYKNWGFHVDSTIFIYLKTPKESLASTPVWLTLMLFLSSLLTISFYLYLYLRFFHYRWNKLFPYKWFLIPILLIIQGLLIIPIRGGVGIAPINIGTVFFSQKTYANHTAINIQWNFLKSLTEINEQKGTVFMSDSDAEQIFKSIMAKKKIVQPPILHTQNPNIILIILESFTANVIEPLNGTPDVTPHFTQWAKQGLFFEKMYATGDRSDKGIVAILSGYPAQPTTSIIKFTNKTEKLPQLSKILKNNGYHTSFYYGGEINFANMNSYFMSGGYDQLVTLPEFPKETLNSKWGAHDHVVFNRMFQDIQKTKKPFFNVMFTLSSHDPFDVPHQSKFSGIDWNLKFLNSVHYTDSCLNDFLTRSSQTNWWDNTWVILVADHGVMYPRTIAYNSPDKFHIPMVWTGGAITVQDSTISSVFSQTDIPLMILNQMQIETDEFYFSKDNLISRNYPFAYYAYNNGFGFITDSAKFIWDLTLQNYMEKQVNDSLVCIQGKAYYQSIINDFLKK